MVKRYKVTGEGNRVLDTQTGNHVGEGYPSYQYAQQMADFLNSPFHTVSDGEGLYVKEIRQHSGAVGHITWTSEIDQALKTSYLRAHDYATLVSVAVHRTMYVKVHQLPDGNVEQLGAFHPVRPLGVPQD